MKFKSSCVVFGGLFDDWRDAQVVMHERNCHEDLVSYSRQL
jgi:hypothetical protein